MKLKKDPNTVLQKSPTSGKSVSSKKGMPETLKSATNQQVALKKQKTALNKQQRATAQQIELPPFITQKLSLLSDQYGLPFNLGELSLEDVTVENVKALRSIADANFVKSKMFPELIKQVNRIMKADISLAEAKTNLAKASLKHQEKLDQNVANLFLSLAQHKVTSTRLASQTAKRVALLEKREAQREEYQNNTVFANSSRMIDLEYEIATDNNNRRTQAKTTRKQTSNNRRKELEAQLEAIYI